MTSPHTDVLIVGAGIIGLAHAYVAHEHGHSVRVLERDARAVGASVRNFGHVCTTAQPREMQPIAQKSRAGWLRATAAAGIHADECGAVVIARSETQMQVLRELAAERGEQVAMLNADEVRERLQGLAADTVRGGAHLRDDLRVDPRTTAGKLTEWLNSRDGVDVRFRHAVQKIEADGASGYRVITPRGEFTADRVIVCVGHDVDYLFPQIADEYEVYRCRLSMGRLASPDVTLAPAILTGTSMARYGAFVEQPSASALMAELRREAAELLAVDANVMATQLPDGSVIVGDTHDSDLATPPFMSQRGYDAVVNDFVSALDFPDPQVIERWQGIYATSPRQDVLRAEVSPGLEVVSVTSGIGMTLSFGIAAESFEAR